MVSLTSIYYPLKTPMSNCFVLQQRLLVFVPFTRHGKLQSSYYCTVQYFPPQKIDCFLLLLMLEIALQEANAQLERKFLSEVIRVAIVFQQRGDDIAKS